MSRHPPYPGSFSSPLTVSSTGSSSSYIDVRVEGISGGDPHVRFTIPSGASWYLGPDNSASDTCILGTGTAVGTNGLVYVTTGGDVGFGASPTVDFEINKTEGSDAAVHQLVRNQSTGGLAILEFLSGGSISGNVRAHGTAVTGTQFGITRAGAVFFTGESGANGMWVGNANNAPMYFGTNSTIRNTVPAAGGLVIGTAALTTTATDGFLYIPTCAGTPTGVPTAQTGTVAMVFDTTNNKLYVYDGSWLGGTSPGAFT